MPWRFRQRWSALRVSLGIVSRRHPRTSSSGSSVRRRNSRIMASSSGVSTVLRGSLGPIGASAVVKRPRHLATVPDDGTVQLDRADHTRRQGATAARISTGRRRKRPAEGRRRRLLLKLRRGNQCDEGKAAIGLLSNNQQLHSQIARFFSFYQLK